MGFVKETRNLYLHSGFSGTVYVRRTQMAGCAAQSGNGFEMLRQLCQEHHGGAEAVQLGGMRRHQEWPKCTSIENPTQHLDAWVECLETHTHSTELLSAPNDLRSMLMGVIPTEHEDEILVRPETATYTDMIEYCKRRTTYNCQTALSLSELTRRSAYAPRINALDGTSKPVEDDQIPSWAIKTSRRCRRAMTTDSERQISQRQILIQRVPALRRARPQPQSQPGEGHQGLSHM